MCTFSTLNDFDLYVGGGGGGESLVSFTHSFYLVTSNIYGLLKINKYKQIFTLCSL